jgi:DNA topoisomerase-1
MRTDIVNLSNEAKKGAESEIVSAYGVEYSKPRNYKGKSKGAQEAHEAIRPTNFANHSVGVERDQARLYDLIWKRAIASQMSEAKLERTNLKIQINSSLTVNEQFSANGEIITFEGFLKVYLEGHDDEDAEQDGILPDLKINENLENKYITATERFTRPPSRFTEAALVKKLEELGIGRPSTYAPTISTIQNRNYIEKGAHEGDERKYKQLVLQENTIKANPLSEISGSNKGKLVPTDIGTIVTDFLVNHFESILDYNFTARVEASFDDIAGGKEAWRAMMKDFYKGFHPQVEDVQENAERESGERILGEDPETGRRVSVRLGKFGPMVQIGTVDDEEKPKFASLSPDQQLSSITYEEAMNLFQLPKSLGHYKDEEVEVNNGRFGPYVKFGKKFVSLPKGLDPLSVDYDQAVELIVEKEKADAPIYTYQGLDVQKGKGRFGPFIKWNNMFINVNKKYDWDNLSDKDIVSLIEDKIQKEKDKIIHNWEAEGIRVEKARWKRHNIIKGKQKVELPKTVDVTDMTLEEALAILEKNAPKKKVTKRKTAANKKTTKKK